MGILMSATTTSSSNNNNDGSDTPTPSTPSTTTTTTTTKRIVFIRHGCTYMNEYLGLPGKSFGSPNFTDVFPNTDQYRGKYQDSTLSERGTNQAVSLGKRLTSLYEGKKNAHVPLRIQNPPDRTFLNDLDLVVVSPLARSIQTYELGLLPVLERMKDTKQGSLGAKEPPAVVCLPEAAERLYLISDIGKTRTDLSEQYNHLSIDFETGFWRDGKQDETWWFRLDDDGSVAPARPSGITSSTYQEWRPASQNQVYACPGEPDEVFDDRMMRLYWWLEGRPEATIAVVCHWGVIDWFLESDFGNCELEIVPFDDIQPARMVKDS